MDQTDCCIDCRCEEHVVQMGAPDSARKSPSEMVKQTQLRYTDSLDSATQWRHNLNKRPLRRCASSAMTLVSFGMAILVLGSIGVTRFLTWGLIEEDLTNTSEEGQRTNVKQVEKEVQQYFQIGSGTVKDVDRLFSIVAAQVSENESAVAHYWNTFGKLQWASVFSQRWVADVLVTQARNPDVVNASFNPDCELDTALFGSTYAALVTAETTGLSPEAANASTNEWARADQLVGVAVINDDEDLSNPLGIGFELPPSYYTVCSLSTFSSGEMSWAEKNLPGNWTGRDHGLTRAIWASGILVDPGTGLVRKSLFFPLPGPEWAPKTAFGRINMIVDAPEDIEVGDSLQDNLRRVAEETGSTIFLLDNQGGLLASSVEDQLIIDKSGLPWRLVRGDTVQSSQIQQVAEVLMGLACSPSVDGGLSCDWSKDDPALKAFQDLSYAGDDNQYAVVTKPVDDELAANLGMLLVVMVDTGVVRDRIDQINLLLVYLALAIMGSTVVLFVLLSRQVTVPLQTARDNMFLLSDMKIDEAIDASSDDTCCRRPWFTEASDLRLSFLHAAGALKTWRTKETERRTLLEQERSQRILHTVEKAVQGAGKLMHPMVLVSAEQFMQLECLVSYEELRNESKLEFLDTEDDLAKFKASHSIIFLSHQWLGWGYPDDEQHTQLKAMKSAVKTAAQHMRSSESRAAWKNLYVWVDYCSIAQEHRGMQTLAISSLPVYASSADVFIIVAPPAKHVESNNHADLDTYNSRGWCRAEMLAKICSSGLENFFVLSTEGSELQRVTEDWLPSLSVYVFEGEFSCCQQGHRTGTCDKEALVEPVLGLYSLLLRQAKSSSDASGAHMEKVLRHIVQSKERFFPNKYTYKVSGFDGVVTTEERELFGPLVEALETYMHEEEGAVRSTSNRSMPSAQSKVFWVF
jgi:hypothetical protein